MDGCDNPLRAGLVRERVIEPCALVICGATGDLTRRKLVPALFRLYRRGALPANFAFVGFARRPWTDDSFRDEVRRAVETFGRKKAV
ncbi:MAG: glucose-6-phosphate dehydrogenase, partial [Planctomycetes bacterium]|nr:glucose-6-phosphate dehydrogenase [Planctomycetota bacterium]